jgi:hypothetical protein
LVRKLGERLGLSALIVENIMDARRGKNTQLPLPESVATVHLQSLGRIRGSERCRAAVARSDVSVDRSEKIWDREAALPSRLHWFETEVLSQNENLEGLSRTNRELLVKAEAMDSLQRVVLDMDSTEIPVYGNRSKVPTTGILNRPAIYHPLLLFNGEGDCLGAKLRPGNVHSARGLG